MTEMHGSYDKQQIEQIRLWENAPPSHLARMVGFFSAPLAWAARKAVPDHVMDQALEMAFDASAAISGSDDLLSQARHLGYEVKVLKDLQRLPLYIGDALSASVVHWAKGLGAAEGAVTGMGGIAGLVIDVPALLVLVMRTIRKIGACYGFDAGRDDERSFMAYVLSAGAANTVEEKTRAIASARALQTILDDHSKDSLVQKETEIIGKEAFAAAVRNLVKQLCINLTRRKAAQTIPIIGGGIGAAINVMFVSDVAEAATRLYQQRRRAAIEAHNITGSLVAHKG